MNFTSILSILFAIIAYAFAHRKCFEYWQRRSIDFVAFYKNILCFPLAANTENKPMGFNAFQSKFENLRQFMLNIVHLFFIFVVAGPVGSAENQSPTNVQNSDELSYEFISNLILSRKSKHWKQAVSSLFKSNDNIEFKTRDFLFVFKLFRIIWLAYCLTLKKKMWT